MEDMDDIDEDDKKVMNTFDAHLNDLKSLRSEINWRVKVAYTSSAAFISLLGIVLGLINKEKELNPFTADSIENVNICLVISAIISIFVGIINSNHLTEKRIELYSLQLQKILLKKGKEPIFSWLSFMYGYKTNKDPFLVILEKFFNAGLAFFQYALPNLLAIGILVAQFDRSIGNESAYSQSPHFFIIITIIVAIATFSSIYGGLFVCVVNKHHTRFYRNHVEPYYLEQKFPRIFNLTAHRCGASLAPENTLEAIRKTLCYNPDRMELDVHLTKDSRVVVIHDSTINRTTNGVGKINEMNYDQLLQYNIVDEDGNVTNFKIPTLEQVIDEMKGQTVLLIEIKPSLKYSSKLGMSVLDIINTKNARGKCIIQSFDSKILKMIHLSEKRSGHNEDAMVLHKLYNGKIPFFPIWLSHKFEFGKPVKNKYIKEISINNLFVTKDVIRCIHQYGMKVNVWTVDDIERIKSLIDDGVDGIITNNPEIIKLKKNG